MYPLRFPPALLAVVSLSFVSCEYSITVYPQILSQQGRTDFEPDRWNGHGGLDREQYIAGNKAIGSRPARWNNPDYSYFKQAPQDPHRKGYADPNYFRNKNLQASITSFYREDMNRYGKDMTIVLLTWGKFWPSWMDTSAHGGILPNNLDAGADMVLLLLEAIHDYTGGLPTYYEVNNEPEVWYKTVKWETVIQYQKTVANKVHAKFPHLKIIGPSKDGEIQGADGQNLRIWGYVKEYMDMSLHNLNAFSFHPYNAFYSQNGKHSFTGANEARLSGFVDMVESYAVHKTGKTVPIVITEYGLGGITVDSKTTSAMVQWAYIYQHNCFMFTYLNQRGVVDKAIAFLNSGHQQGFGNASIFNTDGTETHVSKAYRFWNHMDSSQQFLRVDNQFNGKERTISPLALYNKHDNKVTVLFHNYAQSSEIVTVNFNPSWMRPTSADMTCLYLGHTGAPVLDTQHLTIHEGKVNLKPESSCFIRFHTTYNFHVAPTYLEQTIYAKDLALHIAGTSVHTTVHVPSIHNVLSIVLRIGVSNANKAVKTAPTQIHINSGTVPTGDFFTLFGQDKSSANSQWKIYNYKVPTHEVKTGDNTINLHFAQSGGYVTSVALVIGTISGN